MELFLNRVWATLASGLDASQTNMPLTAGHGARFGTIAAGDKVRIELLDATLNVSETVYATARSGDTLTVTRAQDGTAAAIHLVGERLEARIGKSTMDSMMQQADIQNGAETLLGSVTGTNTIAAAATPTLIAQAATGSFWKLPAAGANTGATTANIDGMGAVAVVRPDGTALQANDIPAAGYICLLEKRAADYVLLNPSSLASILIPQTHTAFTTAGTSTAFTLTPMQPLTAYAAGQRFRVKFNATAGASPTLAVSGLVAKALMQYNTVGVKVACSASTIIADMLTDVEYDGVDFVVLNPAPAVTHALLDTSSTVVTQSVGNNTTAPASTAFCEEGFVNNDVGAYGAVGQSMLMANINTYGTPCASNATISGGVLKGVSLAISSAGALNGFTLGATVGGTWRNISGSIIYGGGTFPPTGDITCIGEFQRIS